jgi:hypothetical protein
MDEFGLDFEQTRILHSFQYFLVQADIDKETEFVQKQLKLRWLNLWKESVENFLDTVNNLEGRDCSLYINYPLLDNAFRRRGQRLERKRSLYSIVLELSLFTLYAPFGTEQDEQFNKLKLSENFRPQIIKRLEYFAHELGVERECITRFKSNYQMWSNEITGINQNPFKILLGGLIGGAVVAAVAAAIAIPVLVPLLAPILAPGLSGAAAISAVLAALGGGAIAVGGFGMAGGMVVIVGGGVILGAGAGTGVGSLFAQSPDLAVREAAKFLVTFNKIILAQTDVSNQEIAESAREIIRRQRNTINELEEQILERQMRRDNDQQEIDNRKKVVIFLRKALEISQNLLK